MKRYGLLGEKLAHSYSPRLHGLLGDYSYELWPMPPQELDEFLRGGAFDGLNVTIPYKQAVIPYCKELSETAKRIGSVNTVVRRADASLFGDNTDAAGFTAMAERAGISFAGKKTLVLGSGGTSLTACAVIREAGGEPVVISRTGENRYEDLQRYGDARVIVNTTPVGMYPGIGESPVDLSRFPALEGVLDVIYNPLRTRLLQQAQALSIPCAGGLPMLVAQAARASELFTGQAAVQARVDAAETELRKESMNLVLVGMPGCGKSTLGMMLSQMLQMPLADLDEKLECESGMPIPQVFEREGEEGFRLRETELIARFGKEHGKVLVTGGGAVLREENRMHLRANGFVVWVQRDLQRLATQGRPLSKNAGALAEIWARRKALYEDCADCTVHNDGPIDECARKIVEAFA